ncbi:hypothetical protein FERRO_14380 [Ferrovum sp. JA12]|nr:hypothetical protein FERRO_14380 [Ferrovum sp. JA12]
MDTFVDGHRARPAARAARTVPCFLGRTAGARCARPDGVPVLFAGQEQAHGADRLSHQQRDGAGRRHRRAWPGDDLGCRHPDLGRQPDRRGTRCGHPLVAADGGHTLRNPALHRSRHVAARLPAPQSCAGSLAVHQCCHVDPSAQCTAPAPLLVDQRVEGARGRPGPAAGHRADPAGLVLRRCARREPGIDHRRQLLPLDRRHRALAVPPGAQARRLAARRLALRFSAAAPKIRQPGALHRLRLRPAPHRGASAFAGLHACHPAAEAWAGSVDLPRRAVHGTAATRWQLWCRPGCHQRACGKAVNPLVLSGVEILVLSGAALSCYQEYEQAAKCCVARVSAPLNLVSNFESIKLTIRRARALWINRFAGGHAS